MNQYSLDDECVIGNEVELEAVNRLIRERHVWWMHLTRARQISYLSQVARRDRVVILADIIQLFTNPRYARKAGAALAEGMRRMERNNLYRDTEVGVPVVGPETIVRGDGVVLEVSGNDYIASAERVVRRAGDVEFKRDDRVVLSRGVDWERNGNEVRVQPTAIRVDASERLERVGDVQVGVHNALVLEERDGAVRFELADGALDDTYETVMDNNILVKAPVELVDPTWHFLPMVQACCLAWLCCLGVAVFVFLTAYSAMEDNAMHVIYYVAAGFVFSALCVCLISWTLLHVWTPGIKYSAAENVQKVAEVANCPRDLAAHALSKAHNMGASPNELVVLTKNLKRYMLTKKESKVESNYDNLDETKINIMADEVAKIVTVASREQNAVMQRVYENGKTRRRFASIRDAVFGGGAATLFSRK
jgi:hypothetical protein